MVSGIAVNSQTAFVGIQAPEFEQIPVESKCLCLLQEAYFVLENGVNVYRPLFHRSLSLMPKSCLLWHESLSSSFKL
jgi:hypothetical protein